MYQLNQEGSMAQDEDIDLNDNTMNQDDDLNMDDTRETSLYEEDDDIAV